MAEQRTEVSEYKKKQKKKNKHNYDVKSTLLARMVDNSNRIGI